MLHILDDVIAGHVLWFRLSCLLGLCGVIINTCLEVNNHSCCMHLAAGYSSRSGGLCQGEDKMVIKNNDHMIINRNNTCNDYIHGAHDNSIPVKLPMLAVERF